MQCCGLFRESSARISRCVRLQGRSQPPRGGASHPRIVSNVSRVHRAMHQVAVCRLAACSAGSYAGHSGSIIQMLVLGNQLFSLGKDHKVCVWNIGQYESPQVMPWCGAWLVYLSNHSMKEVCCTVHQQMHGSTFRFGSIGRVDCSVQHCDNPQPQASVAISVA